MMEKKNNIRNKNPFRVPEDYFENLNRRIIEGTSGKGMADAGQRKIFRLKPYLAIAASVAVLVLLSYTGIRLFSSRRPSFPENMTSRELYIETMSDDIGTSFLELNAENLDIPDIIPEVGKDDIIEYLVQDDFEISDVYEQL
jgi:hypothetical protein